MEATLLKSCHFVLAAGSAQVEGRFTDAFLDSITERTGVPGDRVRCTGKRPSW